MANFEKFAQEANTVIKELAAELGHPKEVEQVLILLRASLHALRDRITISQSLHLLAQLPIFLKGIYVEQWKYRDTPIKFDNLEEFKDAVKQEQAKYGETRFDWPQATDELVRSIFNYLGRYWAEGEMEDVVSQLPPALQSLFEIKIRGKAANE